jgi:hypothetical protein
MQVHNVGEPEQIGRLTLMVQAVRLPEVHGIVEGSG